MQFIRPELQKSLNELEREILGTLSHNTKARSKEIHQILIKKGYRVAPTSVTVLLDRLYKAKATDREIESCRGGYRYIYSLKKSSKDFEKKLVENSVNKLIEKFGSTAVAYFNERFGEK